MWLGLLGPLYVRDGELSLTVQAPKQRVLLALLAVHANRVVSFDEIADTLWDGTPAPGAHVTVRNYVLRLRKVLGPRVGPRIVTRDPGYLIEVGGDELDTLRFETLRRKGGTAARSGDWQRAADVLDEALGLWRGPPLADVSSQLLRRDEVPPLIEARLQAQEWRFEAALRLGRAGDVLAELKTASIRHPLREPFHAQLMLALYRVGRQADALAVYGRVRRTLAGELGIEPGAELRRLHDRILGADPDLIGDQETTAGPLTRPERPRQLPAATTHFAGRVNELKELNRLLDQLGERPAAQVIAVVGGTAGIGKTALALHWASLAADRFPDGQLYANLRGFDPSATPAAPAEAIRGFLEALAVPAARIPAGEQDQASLYRSILADRRVLVVLDNAKDEQQVRPLIPAGPGCRTLVTSRDSLLGLVASQGACSVTLDLLTELEARDLLGRRLGPERLAAEPDAVSEVVRSCARLPLALAIAAARAVTSPALPLAGLAAELRDSPGRLDALDLADASMSVRGVFDWSYRGLRPATARLFRLLGRHPGPDISVAAAAGLGGSQEPETRRMLRELTRACLLTEPVPGRYTSHDLLREYGAELARSTDSEQEQQAALRRLYGFYLHTAFAAALGLNSKRRPITLEPQEPGVLAGAFASEAAALAWLDAERSVLLAAVTSAQETGFGRHGWQLAWTLSDYFSYRGHWPEWHAALRAAATATEQAGDLAGQVVVVRHLGQAAASLGDYGTAREHLERCVALCEQAGDQVSEAAAHHDCARICYFQGELTAALGHAQRSLHLSRAVGQPAGLASALNGVGWCLAQLGEHEQALRYCEEALELNREIGNRAGEAMTLDSVGYIHHQLSHHEAAISYFRQAAEGFAALGDRPLQADTLTRLGDTYAAADNEAAAREVWHQALTIMEDLDHPAKAKLQAKLTLAGTPSGLGRTNHL